MMRVKFNKFERVAGLFVGMAIFGFFASMASLAIKQGWFESKVQFSTKFQNVDGVHSGTAVQIAGIKAGSVDEVELLNDKSILVKFSILSKYRPRVKEDSQAQLIRPFIIGERIMEVTVGSETSPELTPGATMNSHETMDLMSLMSGRNLGDYLETLSSMMQNLKYLAETLLNKERTQAFIDIFDKIEPLIRNMNSMSLEVIKLSRQATKNENLSHVLGELAITTKELNKLIPEINRQAPQFSKDLTELVTNMAVLTKEFKVLIPALAEVAPDLPKSSRRALEALDEAVVLIKAMQRTFFVKGAAEDVREEEEETQKKSKDRKPAAQ